MWSSSRCGVLGQPHSAATSSGLAIPSLLERQSSLHSFEVAPGYQYDIIRRRRGHLGLAVQFDLLNTTAKISAAAQITGEGMQQAAVSASKSLLAPLPVAGPQFRLYLTNSPRVFIEGNVYGIYFFGYGNFVSSAGDLGVTLTKHITVTPATSWELVLTSTAQATGWPSI